MLVNSPLEHLAAFGVCFILGAGAVLGLDAYKRRLMKKTSSTTTA